MVLSARQSRKQKESAYWKRENSVNKTRRSILKLFASLPFIGLVKADSLNGIPEGAAIGQGANSGDIQKLYNDLMGYGQSFSKGGERIPPKDIYMFGESTTEIEGDAFNKDVKAGDIIIFGGEKHDAKTRAKVAEYLGHNDAIWDKDIINKVIK
jgi:hypothetical protein